MGKEEFGKFFKKMRMKLRLTLREFCLKYGLDSGNISKLERGLLPPRQSHEKLKQYATFLQIQEGSDEWYEFFDLAAASTGKTPESIMSDARLVGKLPLVFCTLRGRKVSEDQLDELAEVIRKA